jgi:hypothetical protein
MGADELSAGYHKHYAGLLATRYRRLPGVLHHPVVEPAVGRLPVAGGVAATGRRWAKRSWRSRTCPSRRRSAAATPTTTSPKPPKVRKERVPNPPKVRRKDRRQRVGDERAVRDAARIGWLAMVSAMRRVLLIEVTVAALAGATGLILDRWVNTSRIPTYRRPLSQPKDRIFRRWSSR